MKTIRAISIFILFSIASLSVLAVDRSFKGDTIWYKYDKMLVEIVSNNFISTSPEKLHMDQQINQLIKILDETAIAEPADGELVVIDYRDMSNNQVDGNYKNLKLRNEIKKSLQLVVFDDGTLFEKDYGRYSLCIYLKDSEWKISVDQLSDLSFVSSDTFKQKAQNGTGILSEKLGQVYRKSPVQAWIDLRNDEPEIFIQSSTFKAMDMLLISGGIGSGWVKNTFVSDINFRFGLGFARKGMMKNIYSLDWSMMYDFSNSSEDKYFDLNHFASLGWEHNFSNTPMEEKWYGFSFGYLVIRKNDFFKENTFRLSVNKKINNAFSIKPELYFNDSFKNIYPGIRVAVVF